MTPPSTFLLDERVFVSLGILKIAAMLESRGIRVEHVDLSGISNPMEAIGAVLRASRARQIGLTVTTPQLPIVRRLVAEIRRIRPDMKIILGGPHITLSHSAMKLELRKGRRSRACAAFEALQELGDVLVSGDGEFAVFTALTLDRGLIDGDDPSGPYFMTDEVYESTPFPARHLVNMDSYHYGIDGRRSTSLIAQLGCPFGCGFCGGRNSKSLRRIRMRSSASIIAEIRSLYRTYGFTGFMFYDDELNVNTGMLGLMAELSALQEELGAEFRFRGFVKAQLFTREQARAMYSAGFRWLLSGFESGSPRILENINKRSTLAENQRALDHARAAGLQVKALMSVGHPGESAQTIEQTQRWLLEAAPDDFDCTIITTYPGTPYYDEAEPHAELSGVWTYVHPGTRDRLHAYEVNFQDVADYYKGDPNGGYRSYVFTDHLSAEKIVEGRSWIESSVRSALRIPYPKAAASVRFEHSMGQGSNLLPGYLFASSSPPATSGRAQVSP